VPEATSVDELLKRASFNENAESRLPILIETITWLLRMIPPGSDTELQMRTDALLYLSQPRPDELRIGLTIASLLFGAPNRTLPSDFEYFTRLRLAILRWVSPDNLIDPGFYPIFSLTFRMWRTHLGAYFEKYAQNEELDVLIVVLRILSYVDEQSGPIEDLEVLRMIRRALEVVRRFANCWDNTKDEAMKVMHSEFMGGLIPVVLDAALPASRVVRDPRERSRIGFEIVAILCRHLRDSMFQEAGLHLILSISCAYMEIPDSELEQIENSPASFWHYAFEFGKVNDEPRVMAQQLFERVLKLGHVETALQFLAGQPYSEGLMRLLFMVGTTLPVDNPLRPHAGAVVRLFLSPTLNGFDRFMWIMTLACFSDQMGSEVINYLIQSSFDLLSNPNKFAFTVGVSVIRWLTERNIPIPDSHIHRLIERPSVVISTDGIKVMEKVGSRNSILSDAAIQICLDEIETELSVTPSTGDRFDACCDSLGELLAAHQGEFPVDRLFNILRRLLDPEFGFVEGFIAFAPSLMHVLTRTRGAEFISAILVHVSTDPKAWWYQISDLSSVILTFICLRPMEIPDLAIGDEPVGARLIVSAFVSTVSPESYFPDVCGAMHVLAALIQSGHASEPSLIEDIYRLVTSVCFTEEGSDGALEMNFRFHCGIQVFASILTVTELSLSRQFVMRWLEMIQEGLFMTDYLRLLCVFAMPPLAFAFPDLPIWDIRGKLITNTIPASEQEGESSYSQAFDFSHCGKMPIENRRDEITGFVVDEGLSIGEFL
jgi:hypothetical protein